MAIVVRPSDIQIPVFYPNGDPVHGGGMDQGDYDHGAVGADDFRTVVELLDMPTFNLLDPEFQRRYIAFCVGAWCEVGLILGVGTGWRSEAAQAANHARWPNQFAPVSASYHMRKPPRQVAYAIDTVPYDALGWAHANCARFGINYLDHIPNEQHHCQSIELPNSGTAYNIDPVRYSTAAATVRDLPYLRTMSLADWLAADDPITIDGTPPPPPPILSEEDDMLFIARAKSNLNLVLVGNGISCRRIRAANLDETVANLVAPGWGPEYHDPVKEGRPVVTDLKDVPSLTDDELLAYLGYEVDESVPA